MKKLSIMLILLVFSPLLWAETLVYKCPESHAELTDYWHYEYDRAPIFNSTDNIYQTMAQLTPHGATADIQMICTLGQSRMTMTQTISSEFVCQIQGTALTQVMTHCSPGTPPKQCVVTCARPTAQGG